MRRIIYTNFLFIVMLSACDSRPSFTTLCEENPEICQEFTKDTWCKNERIQVGYANWEHKKKPHDLAKYNQLIAYEKYEKCIAKASLIEHIKLKEKTTKRINNLAIAKQKIKRISEITQYSEHPRLLYYHWSRYLNKDALQKLLALENTPSLETPESQFELATYYAKRDPTKTIGLLYHSLELIQAEQEINVEVFKAIATYFTDIQEPKQTYIWLKVLRLYAPDDQDIKQKTLEGYINDYDLDGKYLDKIASATLKKIQSGKFIAPKY